MGEETTRKERGPGSSPPLVTILAGPNGAGKTTVADMVLRDTLGITEYVNADRIASGLSGFDPARTAFAAGRVMMARLRDLSRAGASFAFETTLATRSFAPWLAGLRESGYSVQLVYLWLSSPELAVRRVAQRVREGGHAVPEGDVRRRYRRSLVNLFGLYMPLADDWTIYDNSGPAAVLVATGGVKGPENIAQAGLWRLMRESA